MRHVEGGRPTFHQVLTDLAAPCATTVDWADKGPAEVVEELAADLLRKLQVDFLYLRLKGPTEEQDVAAGRFNGSHAGSAETEAVSNSLARWLHGEPAACPSLIPVRVGSGLLRLCAVPIGGDQPRGAIAAGSGHESFPTQEDHLLLGIAANYVALAARIDSVKGVLEAGTAAFAEQQRDTRRQQALAKIAIKINSSLSVTEPVQKILQAVSDAVADIIGVHMVTLAMTGGRNGAKVIHAVFLSNKYSVCRTFDEQPTAAGIYSEVCRTNRPLRLTHAELIAHPLFRSLSGAADRYRPPRGWLCVPLIGRDGRNRGALHASDKFAGDFTAKDEAVAQQLATLAATAMENCAAFQEIRDADRRKDEFLAILAHELLNPLGPILGAAAVLRVSRPTDQHVQRICEIIERQGIQLKRLVDDLLDASRIGRGQLTLVKERVDVASIVDRALDALRPAIDEQRHEVTLSLPQEPLRLEADPMRLTQILWNLLNNAVKYTSPGGHIWVAHAESPIPATLLLCSSTRGAHR